MCLLLWFAHSFVFVGENFSLAIWMRQMMTIRLLLPSQLPNQNTIYNICCALIPLLYRRSVTVNVWEKLKWIIRSILFRFKVSAPITKLPTQNGTQCSFSVGHFAMETKTENNTRLGIDQSSLISIAFVRKRLDLFLSLFGHSHQLPFHRIDWREKNVKQKETNKIKLKQCQCKENCAVAKKIFRKYFDCTGEENQQSKTFAFFVFDFHFLPFRIFLAHYSV